MDPRNPSSDKDSWVVPTTKITEFLRITQLPETTGSEAENDSGVDMTHQILMTLAQSVGRQEGALDEIGQRIMALSGILHHHIEGEAGVVTQVSMLDKTVGEMSAQIKEFKDFSEKSRIRWGVLLTVSGGICTIIGSSITLLATVGLKPVLTIINHSIGIN